MKKLLNAIRDGFSRKENLVLVTIVAGSGSTPRGPGAKMLVGSGGRITGTIGGAIPEYLAIETGKTLIAEKRSALREYILHPNEVADLGAKCGGEVRVFFQYLDAEDRELVPVLDAGLRCFSSREPSWLITRTDGGGSALAVVEGDRIVAQSGALPPDLGPFLKPAGVWREEGDKTWFAEPLVREGFVYVFGGGHVAQELVPLLDHLGFRCIVFDDREEFTRRELFPKAEGIIRGDFQDIAAHVSIGPQDYVVVVTRGHVSDYDAEAFALKTPARYIGVIGSRTKLAFVSDRLRALGFTGKDLNAERVHAPIGLDIKSETPAEIAVSIAGELILVRARFSEGV
ncbi:MAG: XdhC family protein [Spirochaetaceae bacterium]|jgi:xanthine dehydrogenase accessory factor|nr:XdhC family protein [Spirochaetaceae bacterium]